jgi:cell division protein FtsB
MRKANSADMENGAKKQGTRTLIKGVYVLQALALLLLALNCVLIYAIMFSSKGVLGYSQQCQQVEELDAKVMKLREENHKLFRKIQGFKSDARAQERLIREKLGWVREDELVIEFVPLRDKPAPPAVQK